MKGFSFVCPCTLIENNKHFFICLSIVKQGDNAHNSVDPFVCGSIPEALYNATMCEGILPIHPTFFSRMWSSKIHLVVSSEFSKSVYTKSTSSATVEN